MGWGQAVSEAPVDKARKGHMADVPPPTELLALEGSAKAGGP